MEWAKKDDGRRVDEWVLEWSGCKSVKDAIQWDIVPKGILNSKKE